MQGGDGVVIVGRRGAVLAAAAAELNAACGADRVTTEVADLADPQDVEAVARAIGNRGAVDVLVLNAGGNFGGEPSSLVETADGWRRDFDGNVLTAVLLRRRSRRHCAARADASS